MSLYIHEKTGRLTFDWVSDNMEELAKKMGQMRRREEAEREGQLMIAQLEAENEQLRNKSV